MQAQIRCICGADDILDDYTSGDSVCQICGTVLPGGSIMINDKPESFDPEMERTVISSVFYEEINTIIASKSRPKRNPKDAKILDAERFLAHQDPEMSDMVKVRALELLKRVTDAGVKGQNIKNLAAACLYFAYRKEHVSRSLKEISEVTTVPKHKLSRCLKVVNLACPVGVPSINIKDLVPRMCQELAITNLRHVDACSEVAEAINRKCQGRNPNTVAAAGIYVVTREVQPRLAIADIAAAAKITAVTIRACAQNAGVDVKRFLR